MIGAIFVFFGVYLLVGFFLISATEGSRLEWVGIVVTLLVSTAAAFSSYRASGRRSL